MSQSIITKVKRLSLEIGNYNTIGIRVIPFSSCLSCPGSYFYILTPNPICNPLCVKNYCQLSYCVVGLFWQLEGVFSSVPSLTERMIIMVTWDELFLFVTMMVAVLTYIDSKSKHKK